MLVLALSFANAGGYAQMTDTVATSPEFDLVEGQPLTLTAEVEGGSGPFHYLWFKDHAPIPGAMYPDLKFEAVRASDAGRYWVTVFNDAGSTTSVPEVLWIRGGKPSRLANVSIVAPARDRVRLGFNLGGSGAAGSTDVLARASGPALTQFGVTGALNDPVLTVFQQGRLIASNDDWAGDLSLSKTATAVGAFPFVSSSRDSAVMLSLTRSEYAAEVVDGRSGDGITVVELYDATPGTNRLTPRLVSLSASGTMSEDDAPLTAGFTIEGDMTMRVLLRGLGPALERIGVVGAVQNPRLDLFRGSTLISSNENWSDAALEPIETAQAAVGATALEPGSRDAAIVISLRPGAYTALLSSASNHGVARIEVYEVP